MTNKINIAVDGYAACGKSTLAKDIARIMNYVFIDSGAMYRAITLYFLRNKVDWTDEAAVDTALTKVDIAFKRLEDGSNVTFLNGENVETFIRDNAVSDAVSPVAAIKSVRLFLRSKQQRMGEEKGVVMDGRDIGTVIFPDAALKLFLTASMEVRIQRRFDQLVSKGLYMSKEEIEANLAERDHIDSSREESPLQQAKDAVLIDNSNISREEQLAMALSLVDSRCKALVN